MNGRPLLSKLAQVLQEHGLEAILIGNAAAVLNGVRVTRGRIDFLFRKTPGNFKKLSSVARSLGATVWRATCPDSDVRRLAWDEDLLKIDFVTQAPGVKSFASLRRSAQTIALDGYALRIADPRDINGKRKAGRPKNQREEIRRLLRLPPDQRTHFLRKRIGIQASCL